MDIQSQATELPGDMPDYYRHFKSALSVRWEDCLDHGTFPVGNNRLKDLSMYNIPGAGSLPTSPYRVPGPMVESATTDELHLPDDQALVSSLSGLAISDGHLPCDWSTGAADTISKSLLYGGHGEGVTPQIGDVDSYKLQNGFHSSTDDYLLNSGLQEDFDAIKFDPVAAHMSPIRICKTHGGYTISNQVPRHPDVAMIRDDERPHFLLHQESLGHQRSLPQAHENLIPSRIPENRRLLSPRNEPPYPDELYLWSGSRCHPVPWSNASATNIHSTFKDKARSVLNSLNLMEQFTSLNNFRKSVYVLAKDQEGCRYLQRKISEGRNKDIEKILLEVADHLVELCMDPFGNYLVQKLFDAGDEDQRTHMLRIITRRHGDLSHISCDIHGTRVVQKIVEILKAPEQLSVLVSSLKPNILILMKNANGTHVAQHCLRFLPHKYMEILFENVATNCIELATDRHGCCVLQKCIAHSSGEQRLRLTHAVVLNSRILSQDEFGNYAVQYILDKNEARAAEDVITRLAGHFIDLSMQKYSSNVVESCLKLAEEEHREYIVQELIQSPRLDQVLQDPYGNYVIQSAITTSKGALRAAIVKAIKPYIPALLTNPYGKKVLTNKCLKNVKWRLV
ncbi:hypothetical protein MLD38_009463 [Melastoma candidum]|uniref:Uncharacterized protein n=1 Tax=Melastoma candidum TaxID=119954 RepID=A0ACB9RXM8_9MYRT|nr:hypothetical protein MLD38_009463 [Melastoma candidum]